MAVFETVRRQLDDLDRIVMLNSKIASSGYLLAFLGYACSHLTKASGMPSGAMQYGEKATSLLYLAGAVIMGFYLWELRKLSVHAVNEGV
jgi:hypothetical protein